MPTYRADSVPPIRFIPFDEVNAAPAVARQENVDSAPAPERLPAPPQDLRWLRVEAAQSYRTRVVGEGADATCEGLVSRGSSGFD